MRARAYLLDFLPAMAGYVVVLVAVVVWGDLDGTSGWRFGWALLPLIPALLVVRAVVRHLRRVDEYQRDLLLAGLGTGFAVAMMVAVTLGFLGVAGFSLSHGLSGWIVYGAGMSGWLVAGLVNRLR